MGVLATAGTGPYRIEFESRAGYLRAHVTGVNGSLATTVSYWREIAATVRRLRPQRLLVVDDMLGEPPPPEDMLRFVQAMDGQGYKGVRIAYVEADGSQLAQVELGEIYARDQGYDARVFLDESVASLWLRYGES